MHFQNRRRTVAFTICALLLSLNIMSAYTVPVHASTVTHASLYKVADMALAKTGIVANSDIINSLINDILTDVQTVYNEFTTYCKNLSIDIADATTETWNEFATQCTDTAKAIINEFPDMVGLIIWLCTNALSVTMENIADYIIGAGTEGITTGIGYKISDEAVEYIKDEFDEMVTTGEFGYYYVTVKKTSDLPAGWFNDIDSWGNMKSYIDSGSYNTCVIWISDSANYDDYAVLDNSVSINYIRKYNTSSGEYMTTYADDWTDADFRTYFSSEHTNDAFEVYDQESFNSTQPTEGRDKHAMGYVTYFDNAIHTRFSCYASFWSKEGGKQIVYSSLDAFKQYSVGKRPYYQVTTNDYSTSIDNSIDFTGSYYQNNSNKYTYETIQNEIDNSTEINEETINNIVNNTTSTIINNYYTGSDSDNGEDTDNNDNVIGDNNDYTDELEVIRAEIGGLGGALIDVALHHFDIIEDVATVIRDGAETATDPINDTLIIIDDTMNNLSATAENLGEDLKGVGGFMADIYSFIPEKVMNLLIASAVGSIGLGLWNAFRK